MKNEQILIRNNHVDFTVSWTRFVCILQCTYTLRCLFLASFRSLGRGHICVHPDPPPPLSWIQFWNVFVLFGPVFVGFLNLLRSGEGFPPTECMSPPTGKKKEARVSPLAIDPFTVHPVFSLLPSSPNSRVNSCGTDRIPRICFLLDFIFHFERMSIRIKCAPIAWGEFGGSLGASWLLTTVPLHS